MDKIQELHRNNLTTVEEWDDHERDWNARLHATITEDMMGRFAEWKDTQGYIPVPDGQGGIKHIKKHSQKQIEHTTSELIQLFKATL
ncbi:hypothetical protein Pan5_62 [Pseudanabaena phage Pan5]|nr:hypothetical protein Pan5_62 [Pseudanabaena phage Pan5]